jgi:hypothetical protein
VLASAYPVKFVVSLTPGAVLHVYAFQSFRGLRRLVKVPTELLHGLGRGLRPGRRGGDHRHGPPAALDGLLPLQPRHPELGEQLRAVPPAAPGRECDWEDAIYVTFASTVGPNPVEIMIYIIDNYTQNSYDVDNFAEVAEKVAVTPMNFLYQSLDNAFSLLQGLAYQARCAIYLVEDVFHLKFLPEAGEEVDSISESDTVLDSLSGHDDRDRGSHHGLRGDLQAGLLADLRYPGPGDLPVQHREVRLPQGHLRLLRLQLVRCRREGRDLLDDPEIDDLEAAEVPAPAQQDRLEVFDTVLLDFAHPYVASAPVKAMVTSSRYNPEDQKIDVEFWVPVRLGEMVPYTASVGRWNQ